jgi:beta-N-acetylhexosaminidase
MPISYPESVDARAAWLRRLTLEEKIGQLLLIGFPGAEVTPELRQMIEQRHVGGVILFAINGNIQSPAQVARLCADLQRIAAGSGHPGLLIAIDQEGGETSRLREASGFSELPPPMALAAGGGPAQAAQAARLLAAEMRAVGINVDFAPVLDVNVNPRNPIIGVRSFGDDPQRVAEMGVAFMGGLQAGGVLAFGKHFPGHGDTDQDSHLALPAVPHGRARLEAVEFVPFKAAVAAGIDGIMSAHVTFPAFDPDHTPATLSRQVLDGLLRREWGFEGLVVTDSLEMGALTRSLGLTPGQGAVRAFQAGADLLLFNQGYADHRQAFDLLRQALADGAVSADRLEASVGRILRAKQRLGLLEAAPAGQADLPDLAQVGSPLARQEADALALQAISILRNRDGLLPLAADARPNVVETPDCSGLAALLGAPGLRLPAAPAPQDLEAALQAAEPGQPWIVLLQNVSAQPWQAQLAGRLTAAGKPLILVAAGAPYDLMAFPAAGTMLACYGSQPPLLRALARVLCGESAGGRLPVALPGLMPAGAAAGD